MSTKTITILLSLLLVLALIGVADSAYLTYEHFSGGEIVCSVVEGCSEVLQSDYATIGPFPLSLLGVVFYLTLLVLSSMALGQLRSKKILFLLAALSGAGVLASLVLVYLQAVVIEAYCAFCLVSAITTTLFFIVALVAYKQLRKP